MSSSPPAPMPEPLPTHWPYRALYENVRHTLDLLPARFSSALRVQGIAATDLHSFNAPLGAAIESQVVERLNELRELWDPAKTYSAYTFIRQAQRFPDVILRSADPRADEPILLGIELKGWYVLAKEGEPSFRYTVSPAVCAPPDLLVIYPWALENVTSGSPVLYAPYVVTARYAAEYRNWWWQHGRATGESAALHYSSVTTAYPTKDAKIADRPVSDSGGNFGRLARTGIMGAYVRARLAEPLSGIPLWAWQRFFRVFAESRTEAQAEREIGRLVRDIASRTAALPAPRVEEIAAHIEAVVDLLRAE